MASFFIFLFYLVSLPVVATKSPEHSYDILDDNQQLNLPQGQIERLSQHNVWRALIHANSGISQIPDPLFILSKKQFSLKNELVLTLNFLQNTSNAHCQFPARALWLYSQLNIPLPDYTQCNELKEFIDNVPTDDVALVFSAENLSNPSSMMGHILVKFSGLNHAEKQVEHGVSFFTTLDGINVPKILYTTTVSGKKGYFSLNPYSEYLDQYLVQEQRSVWEHQLRMSSFQKKLMQYHIWELKGLDFDYFFTKYNCATLTQYLLATVFPGLLDSKEAWLSPIDVVKNVLSKPSRTIETQVIPSLDWKIRMLADNLPKTIQQQVIKNVETQTWTFDSELTDKQAYLTSLLGRSYLQYRFEQLADTDHSKSFDQVNSEILRRLDSFEQSVPDFTVELTDYKKPTQSSPDSQIRLETITNDVQHRIELSLLPASHTLLNDNRQMFSESELTLGELTLGYDVENNDLELSRFNLYSVTSLIPYSQFTGGLSGSFNIRYQPQFDALFNPEKFIEIGGSLGRSYKITEDMLIFGLIDSQLSFDLDQMFITLTPKVGLSIYEIFNMKSVIEISRPYNQVASDMAYWQLDFKHAVTLTKTMQLNFSFLFKTFDDKDATQSTDQIEYRQFGVGLTHYF